MTIIQKCLNLRAYQRINHLVFTVKGAGREWIKDHLDSFILSHKLLYTVADQKYQLCDKTFYGDTAAAGLSALRGTSGFLPLGVTSSFDSTSTN